MDAHCCVCVTCCCRGHGRHRCSAWLDLASLPNALSTKRSNQALLFISLLYLSLFFFCFFLPGSLMEHTEESSLLSESNKKFFVFHDWGVSVYEPQNCRLLHMIQSTDIMPGTQVKNIKFYWVSFPPTVGPSIFLAYLSAFTLCPVVNRYLIYYR